MPFRPITLCTCIMGSAVCVIKGLREKMLPEFLEMHSWLCLFLFIGYPNRARFIATQLKIPSL